MFVNRLNPDDYHICQKARIMQPKFAKVETTCLPLLQNGSVAIMGTPPGGHHLLGPLHLVVPLRRLLLRRREALPLPMRLQEARAKGRH